MHINAVQKTLNAILTGLKVSLTDPGINVRLDVRMELALKLEQIRMLLADSAIDRQLSLDRKETLLKETKELSEIILLNELADRIFIYRGLRKDVQFTRQTKGLEMRGETYVIDIVTDMREMIGQLDFVPLHQDLFDNASSHGALTKREASLRLNRIVPDHVISPVNFDIVEERLAVVPVTSAPDPQNRSIAAAARDALIEQGGRVLENLRISNCDRRLLEAFERLQDKLTHEQDIVQVGVLNISCENLAASFKDELPTAVEALVRGHSAAVTLFVAQFQAWRDFSEQALLVDLSPVDIADVKSTALSIAARFEGDRERIDESVPRTIRYLASLITDPATTAKRTGYALLTSLENLVARLFSFAAEFLGDTAKQATKKLSTWTARAVVAFVASTVVAAGLELGPVFSRFQATRWVQNAVEILQKVELPVD
ncbi:UNVERIFIED_ORG: hypothetical protein GGD48_004363 [Rhizobium etli]